MKIQPKTIQESMNLLYGILNQGDSRYNDTKSEEVLSSFLVNEVISLEKADLPKIKKPNKEEIIKHFVQGEEKYIAKKLLELKGFKDNEVFYERSFLGFKPDVLVEKEGKVILVECCSCRVSKIIDYLSAANEVWILTYGEPPWKEKPLFNKMQWFIFKRGFRWDEVYNKFKQKQRGELKKIPSPIDSLS